MLNVIYNSYNTYNTIHKTNGLTKLVIANQATHIYQYKNTNRKLFSCNANISFNKKFLKKGLIPKYANIKISNTSPAAKYKNPN